MDQIKHEALLKEMCQVYIKLKTQGLELLRDLDPLNDTSPCEHFIIKTIYNWLIQVIDHVISEPILFDLLLEAMFH